MKPAPKKSASTVLARAISDRQRIDKWLWHARVVRTRIAAAELADCGRVRVNASRIHAASHAVRAGDVVTIALDRVRVLKIVGFSERRGAARAARALYEDLSPASDRRPQSTTTGRDSGAGGRPDNG